MEKSFMSEERIAEVRKSIWDISGEEYHKKVLEYNEFKNEYFKELEEERLKTDTIYRVNYPPLKTIGLWSGGLKSPKID